MRGEEALPSAVIGAPGTSIESFPFGFVRNSFGILFLLVLAFSGLVVVVGTAAPFLILVPIRVLLDFPFGVLVVGRVKVPRRGGEIRRRKRVHGEEIRQVGKGGSVVAVLLCKK